MPIIQPFSISINEEIIFDLKTRLKNTRWPNQAPDKPWAQGTDLSYLTQLCDYWANRYNWREHEQYLNEFPHFKANLDGINIHFLHVKAQDKCGIPLILTHGWPSLFTEMLPLIPFLTDPAAHGIKGPSFDLVIPSLPGYGFSERPSHTGVNYRYVAGLWNRLMIEIGYGKYAAAGTDFGSGVTTLLGLDYPDQLIGIHLSTLDILPYLGESSRPLSAKEIAFVADTEKWDAVERGYSSIQSTKPQTLGYGLNDSPAGLAAWIIEKWRSWSDSHGDLDAHISRDFLLTMITLFWVTQSITSSTRDYYDNRWNKVNIGLNDRVHVPTGIAVFDHQFIPEGSPPREWAERLYEVHSFTQMPRGGHFAAAEEPLLLAQDIIAFFDS